MLMMEMKSTIFRRIKCIRSTRRPVPLSLGRETHWCYGVHAIDLNVATCKGQDGESYEGNVSLNCIITIDGENDMILHPQNTINIPHNKRK